MKISNARPLGMRNVNKTGFHNSGKTRGKLSKGHDYSDIHPETPGGPTDIGKPLKNRGNYANNRNPKKSWT